MSQLLHRLGLGVATTALVAASQTPTWATATEITGVRLVTAPNGIQLLFNVQGNLRPAVFTVNRGNASIADIPNSQLRLPQGGAFRQDNPAPGISSVEVVQLDAKTIRVTVNGISAAPIGEVIREGRDGLQINFITAQGSAGPQVAPTGQPMAMPPGPSAVPPFLPRPVPPPVGDMLISPLNADADVIQLGTNERIPRLLLREAPVREVLSLLARAANMNVVFPEGNGEGGGVTISLDIENESVQDVFNYVLRVTNLKANRQGRTIFVGQALPPDAQNRIVRTIRLNQMRVFGAGSTTREISSLAQTGGTIGSGAGGAQAATTAQTALNRETRTREGDLQLGAVQLLEMYGANLPDTGPFQAPTGCEQLQVPEAARGVDDQICRSSLLRGLEVVGDPRTNTVTLIGSPRKVEIATQLIQQFDIRKRQVMVNVKFIDVNLLRGRTANADLITNFGSSLWGAILDPNGLTVIRGTTPNLGGLTPAPLTGALGSTPVGNLLSDFFAQLRLSIETGNATILTNPTLVIQEGSAAQVNLTQEIFSGIESTAAQQATGGGGAIATQQIRPILRPVGVIFNVTVEQIDDNGFITLQLSPEVSAPSGTYDVIFPGTGGSTGTLISQRRMESGRIRLRDGQTLMLAGIIQDQDRSLVTKIPILGDIPLLGRLFRRESNQRQRNELVVMVTPKIVDDTQNAGFGYQYSPTPGSMPPNLQNQILQPPRRR
ncbi:MULTISPECIES: AMIN domain-containing protein [unclassified Thermosynechococcus]|uniref:AMIN domain-containing protein n=1 Tax=unclassified Thermosynechococcus TaxID=2622553 RepID=UPI0028736FB8|nr:MULTISPECIES: AMIN domain-containing protein [unclassified Thermosynechococcus]WNC32117.1 AMIN domain-containing protein [Thermosynechococcus sp. PKX95]WNC34645.1 AMIN domain-containing protein [Thermosynechococcus sp. PKX91]WNC37162.1 AMIN domain-containing protein [Thermosynechococcus sp. WL11]WNC39684.1 AMIN domain-containing protein [Thermosynechococcus sp. WL17]WNC42204.1 AMIN domain-containing protein [Thermosynechococcus sp. WL15]